MSEMERSLVNIGSEKNNIHSEMGYCESNIIGLDESGYQVNIFLIS